MSTVLVLTRSGSAHDVLPSLDLLGHATRVAVPDGAALLDSDPGDAVFVDARSDLSAARALCRLLRTTGIEVPLIVVLTAAGLAGLSGDWGVDEVLLDTAGPAEIEARLRLATHRARGEATHDDDGVIRSGDLTIDEATFQARLRGEPLDLTFKEFELLKHLAQHPGRVYSRAQLLQEVWGYDYYGGTRTVDVHVRRLRAKLGAEHESLIGTVRHVGYKFVSQPMSAPLEPEASGRADGPGGRPELIRP